MVRSYPYEADVAPSLTQWSCDPFELTTHLLFVTQLTWRCIAQPGWWVVGVQLSNVTLHSSSNRRYFMDLKLINICNYTLQRNVFIPGPPLGILVELIDMEVPHIGITFPTCIICSGVSYFVTCCPCGVWCCALTTKPCMLVYFLVYLCYINWSVRLI